MKKGMEQIFSTSNTGQERFLVLVVYSKARRFETVVSAALKTISGFGSKSAFATRGQPEEVTLGSGESVRVFKTLHGALNASPVPTRTLFTVLVDVLSEPARRTRQKASERRGAKNVHKRSSPSPSRRSSSKKSRP